MFNSCENLNYQNVNTVPEISLVGELDNSCGAALKNSDFLKR